MKQSNSLPLSLKGMSSLLGSKEKRRIAKNHKLIRNPKRTAKEWKSYHRVRKTFPKTVSLIIHSRCLFSAHRRMRTVTNYFLVNLSLSDLLMSILNCICNFIFMLNSDWPFGTLYCSLSNFVSSVTVAAGVFTLMAISFDR